MKMYKLLALLSVMFVTSHVAASVTIPVSPAVASGIACLFAGAGTTSAAYQFGFLKAGKEPVVLSTLEQVEKIAQSIGRTSWSLVVPTLGALWAYAIYCNLQKNKEKAIQEAKQQ